MLTLLLVLQTALAQEPPNACGALVLPADDATTADLLDGFLRLPIPPGGTPFDIPHSVMGPAIPRGEGTLWFFNAGADRMGMLTQRMHMVATDRFPDDVLDVLDPTMHRAQVVADDGTPGVAWWDDVGPGDGNDVHALDVLWRVKNGELVQTSFLLDDKTAAHGEGCTGYALALAKRLSTGAREESLTAHTVQVTLSPTRVLSLDLPDGAIMVSRPGPDFTVVDIDLLRGVADGYAGATLYVGEHPQAVVPGNAPDFAGRLAGRPVTWIVQQTPDAKRRSVQAILDLEERGLKLHVAIEGPLEDAVRLRELVERGKVVKLPKPPKPPKEPKPPKPAEPSAP